VIKMHSDRGGDRLAGDRRTISFPPKKAREIEIVLDSALWPSREGSPLDTHTYLRRKIMPALLPTN